MPKQSRASRIVQARQSNATRILQEKEAAARIEEERAEALAAAERARIEAAQKQADKERVAHLIGSIKQLIPLVVAELPRKHYEGMVMVSRSNLTTTERIMERLNRLEDLPKIAVFPLIPREEYYNFKEWWVMTENGQILIENIRERAFNTSVESAWFDSTNEPLLRRVIRSLQDALDSPKDASQDSPQDRRD